MSRLQALHHLATMTTLALSDFVPCRAAPTTKPRPTLSVRVTRPTREQVTKDAEVVRTFLVRTMGGDAHLSAITTPNRRPEHVAIIDYHPPAEDVDEALARVRAHKRNDSVRRTIAAALAHGWTVNAHDDTDDPELTLMITRGEKVFDVTFRPAPDTGYLRFHDAHKRGHHTGDHVPSWKRLRRHLAGNTSPYIPPWEMLTDLNAYTTAPGYHGSLVYTPTMRVVELYITSADATMHTPDGVAVAGAALRSGDIVVGHEHRGTVTNSRLRWNMITNAFDHPGGMMVFFEGAEGVVSDALVALPATVHVYRPV